MEDTLQTLVETLEKYNAAYRSGKPLVSDSEYDRLVERLREVDPDHPFLDVVEPETFVGKREIQHPVPMLSTEKAYTQEELERFVRRVQKAADEIGITKLLFKVTPKLDGLAGRDDGKIFATRGNGEVGYEISSAFQKGVIPIGGRGRGLGEIVMAKSYFLEHMADKFEHPRNMVVGIVSSDTVNDFARKALQDEMVHFVPYDTLPRWEGNADELLEEIAAITTDLTATTEYPTDGMVVEVPIDDLKNYMGATAHHYRWQIAVKTKGETALTIVEEITWQVGRTGNVTPVLQVRPVSLSGATIRRVTAHHAGLILKERLGIGATIEVIRSGEVIPKLEKVVIPSNQFAIPEVCPSCGTPLEWNNDFLKCKNSSCKAQTEQGVHHWFKTLDNADWLGIKTIQRLVDHGYDSLEKIYPMDENDFLQLGFGPVQSKNLAEALRISKTKPVDDWRFLAAFGISDLGKGDSRKLLSHIKLEELLDTSADTINAIHGFGSVTSKAIENGIKRIKDTMMYMLANNVTLTRTPLETEQRNCDTPITGKGIVFTGKMRYGTREEMEAQARKLGAKVQTAVTGKTDYLVCGENIGAAKIEKATQSGARILSETEYSDLLKLPAT